MAKKPSASPKKENTATSTQEVAAASGTVEPVTTQRAYTLRLRAAVDKKDDKETSQRKRRELNDALWATHEAINAGAKVFGDWLLTLRGGLNHELADDPAFDSTSEDGKKQIAAVLKELKKFRSKDEGEQTDADAVAEIQRRRAARIRDRRILIALSWLSVEDERGAPKGDVRVATGADTDSARKDKVLHAFRAILTAREVGGADAKSWIADCADSLSSKIRDDAVWVNRSAAFDSAVKQIGPTLTREEVWDILEPFFASREAYLAPLVTDDAEGSGGEEKAKDLIQKAGQWLSSRFGTGAGADFGSMAKVYAAMARWAARPKAFSSGVDALNDLGGSLAGFNPESAGASGILSLISGPGYKSATRNLVKAWGERAGAVTMDDVAKFAEVAAEDEAKSKANTGGKGRRPWSDAILKHVETACGFTYRTDEDSKDVSVAEYAKYKEVYNWGTARHSEFAVMLDHAARRVSIGHTWIKRAEAERRRFVEDAKRLTEVPSDAEKWLTKFVDDRSKSSGATDAGSEYRIRRRAIEGWEKVVKRWKSDEGKSKKEREELAAEIPIERSDKSERSLDERVRIAGARQAQAEDEDGKFGDIQLFEALAADDAVGVWRLDGAEGKPNPQPLKNYVLGHDARFKQRRFKVPAYRHPDPLRHPVFGDFGNSRWAIEYAAHEAAKSAGKKRAPSAADAAWLKDSRGLRMGLWNGSAIGEVVMRWSSKRLANDLALGQPAGDRTVRDVTRADRLGRAASDLKPDEAPSASGLFALDDWNGRLQAPRAQLDALADYIKIHHGADAVTKPRSLDAIFRSDERARQMRDHIEWLVSFSAKLEVRGPFVPHALKHHLIEAGREIELTPRGGEKNEWRGIAYPIWHPANDGHKGLAKHILSRVPIRILSVDLGHRYAAACAVWEALDAAELDIRKVIADAKAKGWKVEGSADGLFVPIHEPTSKIAKNGRNKGKPVVETTVYRRVGENFLRDPKTGKPTNTPHPAPWARLDRQFLIKLQGEEKPARMASEDEYKQVQRLEESLGRLRDEDAPLPWRVDELMSEAVRSVRLALRRHGDAARIAYAFMPGSQRHAPGGGTSEHTSESRQGAILDALMRWHDLCGDNARSRWRDPKAAAAWQKHIWSSIATDLPTLAEDADRFERKRHRATLEKALESVVHTLAESGDAGNPTLHNEWKRIWEEANGEAAVVPKVEKGQKGPAETKVVARATGWHDRIRSLADWIMPSGMHARRNEAQSDTYARKSRLGTARNVGGLSLTRIATIRELWQIQKAYRYKAKPDDLRAGIKLMEGDSANGYKFGDRVLQTMERMREQRVKQIASRIAASALGLGGHWKDVERRDHKGKPLLGKDGKPRTKSVWVEEPSPKYPACHAVVIEDLRNYRPDELQTRRENKALMVWSAGKVRKYLEEACQLHGLHLRQLQPNYTSQQDSRTGLPGVRCQDVPVDRATGDVLAYWWKKAHSGAAKTVNDGKKVAEAHLLVGLESHLKKLASEGKPVPATVRVPKKGGDLFVAAPPQSCRANGHRPCPLCDGKRAIQADLNAAANIGLRALLDPDFSGKWWYIPCIEDKAAGTAVPRADKAKGSACFGPEPAKPEQFGSLMAVKAAQNQDGKAGKRKRGSNAEGTETTNFWCDPGVLDLRPAANGGFWMATPAYWKWVRKRAVAALWDHNGLVPQGELGLARDDES